MSIHAPIASFGIPQKVKLQIRKPKNAMRNNQEFWRDKKK